MKKKILAIALVMVLALSFGLVLTACGETGPTPREQFNAARAYMEAMDNWTVVDEEAVPANSLDAFAASSTVGGVNFAIVTLFNGLANAQNFENAMNSSGAIPAGQAIYRRGFIFVIGTPAGITAVQTALNAGV